MLLTAYSRENTAFRGNLEQFLTPPPGVKTGNVYVIPNALVPEQFTPSTEPRSTEISKFLVPLIPSAIFKLKSSNNRRPLTTGVSQGY